MTAIFHSSEIYIGEAESTPLGSIWVAQSEHGLVAVNIGIDQEEFTQTLLKRHGATIIQDERLTETAVNQINAYLVGERKEFNISIDWSVMTPFQKQVLKATMAIPRGETRSYGEIASQVGKPRAARAVGRAEATNPIPLVIPCHRVIGADGGLRGYGGQGGLDTKAWLLELEKREEN